jgi:maltokinase
VTEVPVDEARLAEWLPEQRWFGAKGRELAAVSLRLRLQPAPELELAVAEVRFAAGTHELYQLVPLGDERAAAALVGLLRAGAAVADEEQDVELLFRWTDDERPERRPNVRPMGAEQSNSSIVIDERFALKAFRKVEAGDNPELEMLRFLTDHDFPAIAPLAGWYEIESELVDATLGVVQRFVHGGRDGWELVVDALADGRGEDVLDDLELLGRQVGRMHTVLGSDPGDPAFAPEEPGLEAIGLLTATIDEQIERVFVDLPADEVLDPIRHRGQEVRERLSLMANVAAGGRVIRNHGDLHLGQTMRVGGDEDRPWVILDFEGEPARPLLERRRKRSPLRDAAGMLRSFAYAASAVSLQRGASAPEGWEDAARERFLKGYFDTVDQSLLPPAPGAARTLLSVFELEKAVYELRYELDNRPDWVGIPVAGIARLLEEPIG